MSNYKFFKIQCQISIENIKLKNFDINTSAANDEVNIEFSHHRRIKLCLRINFLKFQWQISIENIKLKKFDINTSAANDEVNI